MSKNIRVLFCGNFYCDNNINEYIRNSKVSLSWANNTLQWGFIKGLSNYFSDISCFSFPQVGSFPFRYKKIVLKGRTIMNEKYDLHFFSYINISLFKQMNQFWCLKLRLLKQIQKSSPDKYVIFVYDLNLPFLRAAVSAKKKNPNIRIVLIVPDLPNLTGEGSFLHQQFIRLQEEKLEKLYSSVDLFILISEFMKEKLPVNATNYITIEGIYNPKPTIDKIVLPADGYKYILYSGAVSLRNGIGNLLEAFSGITDENLRLGICGVGDALEIVQEYAERDKRIHFYGQVLQDDVLKMQQEATLLVNPRTSEHVFSRYSFPSKIMEYFTSGTPTLMYKVDGIPEEYYRYCYTPADASVEGLRLALEVICAKDSDELRQKGEAAKLFIEQNKTPEVQCDTVRRFVEQLFE